jgi:hypothetical protein
MGSWVHGFMGSLVHGFMGSLVHGFMGSLVLEFLNSGGEPERTLGTKRTQEAEPENPRTREPENLLS